MSIKLRVYTNEKKQRVFSIKEHDLVLLLETMYNANEDLICPNSGYCGYDGDAERAGDNVFSECGKCSSPDFHDFADCWANACNIKAIANGE